MRFTSTLFTCITKKCVKLSLSKKNKFNFTEAVTIPRALKHEKEWSVEVPWGCLTGLSWGDASKYPVLICHGRLDASSSFRPLVNQLPEDFHYLAVDLPGNGKSDPFAPGVPLTTFVFVHALKRLVDHFDWKTFSFIGHSLGALIGKHYNFSYPGKMTRMVDMDPVPAYLSVEKGELENWNWKNFERFFDNYKKFMSSRETAPKYTYKQCFEMIKKNRRLTEEATNHVLERVLEPAGDGLYRFTFDQRMKMVCRPPLTSEQLEQLYATIDIPVHTILAQGSIDEYKSYVRAPFIYDAKRPRNSPYTILIVDGFHDVHICYPERVAPSISEFLLKEF